MPANPHSPKPTAIRWREVPMFRLSMVFIPGMIVANLTGIPMVAWLAAFFLSVAIGTGLLYFHLRKYRALVILSLSFFTGGLLIASHLILRSTESLHSIHPGPYTGIISEIDSTSRGYKATLMLIPSQSIMSSQDRSSHTSPQPNRPPAIYAIKSFLTIPGFNSSHKVLTYFSRPDENTLAKKNGRTEKNAPTRSSTITAMDALSSKNLIAGNNSIIEIHSGIEKEVDKRKHSIPENEIAIGDTIQFNKPVVPIPKPQSDFEFDASRYYSSQGIHHRVFLKSGEFTHNPFYGFSWRRSSDRLRKIISHKIKERLADQSSSAIMIAMLIGDKSNINSELKTSYSKAGSIHVLAISGLHIGIIATILIGIIGLPMPQRSKSLALIKASTVLSGIWLFTWISGMSPSATRAAFMFTVYLIGIVIMRKAQILNILGFTAIFLLASEPFLLHNLGFQFSFLALTGIVIWGIPLLQLISFRYRIFQFGWSIIAISLGAQILVAPAILYYFNEISIVSPLTSLVAIPAAYIIVIGGILMLTAEMIWPAAGIFIGNILSQGIQLINRFFALFSELSHSTMNHIYISPVEVTLLACLIAVASLWHLTGRPDWLNAAIPISLLFAFFHCHGYVQKTSTSHLTIYQSKSEFALDVISPGITLSTIHPVESNKYTRQEAQRNRLQYYAGRTRQVANNTEHNAPSVYSIKISTHYAKPYYILYVGSDQMPLNFPVGRCAFIVLAKSLEYHACQRLKAQLNKQDVRVHDMRRQGVFNLTIL